MKCRDFHEMIDSYLSDELLTETNHNVLRHLENCGDCRNVIEARREVRIRLKNTVTNAPQYQIDNHFAHNLRSQLKYEATEGQDAKVRSWFSFGSMAAVAAGLVLVCTFGFIVINNSRNVNDKSTVVFQPHQTKSVSQNNIINLAFGDHEYCAIESDSKYPIRFAQTPKKFEDVEKVVLLELKSVLANYKVKKSHTCQFDNTDFTHVVLAKDNKTVSLMVTARDKLEKLGEKISTYSSSKYELARFDVNETAIFVVSDLDKQNNRQVANTLYEPLQKYLKQNNKLPTSLLVFY